MPNYANAKIYQVISPNHPVPYIGSTTSPLYKRLSQHKAYHRCSARIVIDAGDAYIELIEEYPCENKEQLNKREGEVIRERECVNQRIAGRTHKEYRDSHPEAATAQWKAYYNTHKEALKTKAKERYNANKGGNREAYNARQRANYARRKAKQPVDVLPQQGQEDIHSQPYEAPQPL
jgi:hypothetical protein